jgi:hypothetical protein
VTSGLKAMRQQKDPDGKKGHNERSKMKRVTYASKKKFTGGPARHEAEINCPVFVPGCQPYQCPCKRRAKYDARVADETL